MTGGVGMMGGRGAGNGPGAGVGAVPSPSPPPHPANQAGKADAATERRRRRDEENGERNNEVMSKTVMGKEPVTLCVGGFPDDCHK
ncbi:hypothetical protein GCM10007242_36240 [Pigmentiphaga litoralis]|nr:hypothetical protein GCM10007242_36240 [Pigmentiphaga litoralis]